MNFRKKITAKLNKKAIKVNPTYPDVLFESNIHEALEEMAVQGDAGAKLAIQKIKKAYKGNDMYANKSIGYLMEQILEGAKSYSGSVEERAVLAAKDVISIIGKEKVEASTNFRKKITARMNKKADYLHPDAQGDSYGDIDTHNKQNVDATIDAIDVAMNCLQDNMPYMSGKQTVMQILQEAKSEIRNQLYHSAI